MVNTESDQQSTWESGSSDARLRYRKNNPPDPCTGFQPRRNHAGYAIYRPLSHYLVPITQPCGLAGSSSNPITLPLPPYLPAKTVHRYCCRRPKRLLSFYLSCSHKHTLARYLLYSSFETNYAIIIDHNTLPRSSAGGEQHGFHEAA